LKGGHVSNVTGTRALHLQTTQQREHFRVRVCVCGEDSKLTASVQVVSISPYVKILVNLFEPLTLSQNAIKPEQIVLVLASAESEGCSVVTRPVSQLDILFILHKLSQSGFESLRTCSQHVLTHRRQKKHPYECISVSAESEGFEPSGAFTPRLVSSEVPSATQPTLRCSV
jgi:hypothetical protein